MQKTSAVNSHNTSSTPRLRNVDRNRNSLQKVKHNLRMTIMAKRNDMGEGEITEDVQKPENHEPTEEERERKERRREQNRRAAQRCRRKKRMNQLSVLQNYEWIIDRNTHLAHEVERLRQERQHLEASLKAHQDACVCSAASTYHAISTAGDIANVKQGSPQPTSFSSLPSPAFCPQIKVEPRDESPAGYEGLLKEAKKALPNHYYETGGLSFVPNSSSPTPSSSPITSSCSSDNSSSYNNSNVSFCNASALRVFPQGNVSQRQMLSPMNALQPPPPSPQQHQLQASHQQSSVARVSPNLHIQISPSVYNNSLAIPSPTSLAVSSQGQARHQQGHNSHSTSGSCSNMVENVTSKSLLFGEAGHGQNNVKSVTQAPYVAISSDQQMCSYSAITSALLSHKSSLHHQAVGNHLNGGTTAGGHLSNGRVSTTTAAAVLAGQTFLDALPYIPDGGPGLRLSCYFQDEVSAPLSADGRRSISSVSSDVSSAASEKPRCEINLIHQEEDAAGTELTSAEMDITPSDVSQLLQQINPDEFNIFQEGSFDDVFCSAGPTAATSDTMATIAISLPDHFFQNL